MKSINPVEKEINEIREKLYEEIKDMTPSEMTAYVKRQVAPLHEKYSFQTIPTTRSGVVAQLARG